MHERVVKCLELAGKQRGVLRRDQVLRARVSRQQLQRQLESKHWRRVLPGVYVVAGAPQSWEQRLEAAGLWAARGYVFSHRAAAALWGFARFKPGAVELTLSRKHRAPKGVRCHYTTHLHHREVTDRAGFTVTTAARTLLDLSAETTEPDLRASLDQALRMKWTTVEELEALLERHAGHRGVDLLRALVAEVAGANGPTESELEARVCEVLADGGFPRPDKQVPVYAGGALRRLDFRIPGTRVVIEADGYEHHSNVHAFERDRHRRNALLARGYLVLQWTWAALRERPEALLAELSRVVGFAAA